MTLLVDSTLNMHEKAPLDSDGLGHDDLAERIFMTLEKKGTPTSQMFSAIRMHLKKM